MQEYGVRLPAPEFIAVLVSVDERSCTIPA
jgi:hypothetical protein